MNAEEKKQYLTRIKYHLTMAMRLIEQIEDAPASRESATSLNQQMKMGCEASDEMLRKLIVTPPAPPRA
jgi:hypothetical protein